MNLLTGATVHTQILASLFTDTSVHSRVVVSLSVGATVHTQILVNLLTGATVHTQILANLLTGATVHTQILAKPFDDSSRSCTALEACRLLVEYLAQPLSFCLTESSSPKTAKILILQFKYARK